MRLRTLPLSLAGVLMGILMAAADGCTHCSIIIFTLLTTVCLQILSNISNELGDYLHGTDTDDRTAPAYSLQLGDLSIRDFKMLIIIMIALCCCFGVLMIWFSYGTFWKWQPLSLILLGAFAIWGAMRYTLGKNPYGYRGLGDIFVFIFFGLVSVMGGYFVSAHTLTPWLLLPAGTIGLFSVGVLNVNNIRDMATDAGTRVTVPLRIGEKRAKIYHTILISSGWLLLIVFLLLQAKSPWQWMGIVTLPLYAIHLRGVWTLSGRQLDKMLPLLVMTTFLLTLLVGIPGSLSN